jgi:hypothetical protein
MEHGHEIVAQTAKLVVLVLLYQSACNQRHAQIGGSEEFCAADVVQFLSQWYFKRGCFVLAGHGAESVLCRDVAADGIHQHEKNVMFYHLRKLMTNVVENFVIISMFMLISQYLMFFRFVRGLDIGL